MFTHIACFVCPFIVLPNVPPRFNPFPSEDVTTIPTWLNPDMPHDHNNDNITLRPDKTLRDVVKNWMKTG